mmetsp:Transcript_39263/g.66926  ORF Transcript_39263/g.66926 Transcript_39263/m.66926 type:complete len:423 (-) Transcript_39263:34-1302(-)|eukprot:CAMPEP_0183735176 /NCGR_PEP_ID=MMETSP0737-20130205/45928_1 /TAXON_ID=385413 /ORGANISM="Thalassiosira miniscula, Strain CCMP1093" /LENGTH=422 /DNA_ID=CAMNT_0025968843 /DNA_START=54 /DNA_END=1322 /DNA_ORIENTATION=+
MAKMVKLKRIVLLWNVSISTLALHCFADQENNGINEDFNRLVDWIRAGGGRVDERLGIGFHMHNGENIRGGVALEDIEEGSELLFCPWELVMGTTGGTYVVPDDHCAILEEYAQEVRVGDASFWFPYLAMDDSLSTRIPTVWSSIAISEAQGLPPFDRIDTEFPSLTDWFSKTCAGGKPFEEMEDPVRQSLLAAVTRAAGMRFLPLLDLLNHHNGLLNTISHADEKGNTLRASRKIATGEEIYHSYRGGKGTSSELFRRYGFIEEWPQQYSWIDQDTGKEELRFLLAADDVAMIYPPDSLTSQIGSNNNNGDVIALLSNLRTGDGVQLHNKDLSMERLTQFVNTAARILTSAPTSVEEDKIILAGFIAETEKLNNGERDNLLLDKMLAVKYRIHLKKSLRVALRETESVISDRQDTKNTAEL